jgi:hypothetical protein
MKSSDKVIIYIRLLDEGVPVARPTYGEAIEDNIFRVLPTKNYNPDDETWEFPPGTVVRCERKISPDGREALLAVAIYNIKGESN